MMRTLTVDTDQSPEMWIKSVSLISFRKLFHIRIASNLKDLMPYLVVLTLGTCAVISFLKLFVESLIFTKS